MVAKSLIFTILISEGYVTLDGTTPTYHYYPYGGLMAIPTGNGVQPYLYNGKELDRKKGLDLYDYSARYMDPAVGRFTTMDPLAEKYYSISPYVYCAGNPVKYIDPDGRKIVIGTRWQKFMGKLGLDSYVSKVEKQFKMNNLDSRRIESTYNQLQESELVYRVLPISESPYNNKGKKKRILM